MTPSTASERGVALLITLLAIAVFTTFAAGLALSSLLGRTIAANDEAAIELANATDAALELTARELAVIADWNEVLSGIRTSTLVDGAPGDRVLADGVTINLPEMTNELTCGSAAPCNDAQIGQFTSDRPWGDNNPRWQLFMHAPLPPLPAMPRPAFPVYVVVWVGDDARETDGDPTADGAGLGEEGRYVVRTRVETFGLRGGRHAVEGELTRVCAVDESGAEACLPGVRVHSWRAAK